MKLSCPHCSQTLELTPDVFASLQGQPHFACPSCQGLIAVPAQPQRPMPRRSPPPASVAAGKAQRGLNRNMLVLGVVALVVLGGIAAFLASRNGGSITNIFQNTTNNIIHNNYFTQLIAGGATTMEDLKSIEEIRPYGDGFIGISKAQLNWSQAGDLAKRTGSEVLEVEDSAVGTKQQLIEWLKKTFAVQFQPTLWVRQDGQTKVTDGSDVFGASSLESSRKVALHWKPNTGRTTSDPALATKDLPFVNSLGMKFVPVPDTTVLFCIHETRRQDYAAYAAEVVEADRAWQNPERDGIPCGHEDAHPAVNISWEDARRFCEWLSRKEGTSYRLPTDKEWSYAVGIGPAEKWTNDTKPADLHGIIQNAFPWGKNYPPRSEDQAGNYADGTYKEKFPKSPAIQGYIDAFHATAPVMSFKPNPFGLYDLGGNAWEWCEDQYTPTQRALRGGSWDMSNRDYLLSSCRFGWTPDTRTTVFGFRVVLKTSAPALPTGPTTWTDNTQAAPMSRSPDVQKALALVTRLGGTYVEDGQPVGTLSRVVEIRLMKSQISDADLAQLGALTDLRLLNLSGCSGFSASGLAVLEKLTKLEVIEFWGAALTDEGLAHLAGLKELNWLNIGYSKIGAGSGLVHLKALKKLRVLGLNELHNMDERYLEAVVSLPSLEKLSIQCRSVSDAALDHVRQLTRLQTLAIGKTKITDAGLKKLEGMKGLQSILLGSSQVSDSGVARLQAAIPGLKVQR